MAKTEAVRDYPDVSLQVKTQRWETEATVDKDMWLPKMLDTRC